MHADICDPDDLATVARFKAVLASLGAELTDSQWAIGVDMWRYRIGSETLHVFADTWSVDIDGPRELVQRVVAGVREVHDEIAPVRPPNGPETDGKP
jgi:hypothetical protein